MMDGSKVFLSLGEFFKYLDSMPSSRNVIEGEAILNAGHLIMCGNLERSKSKPLYVFALCLQTSALAADPHEIRGKIFFDEGSPVVSAFRCSCKAGLGGRCKHISALLLYCTRNDLHNLEDISSTDLKCWWKKKKVETKTMYKALPLLKTSCLRGKAPMKYNFSSQDEEETRKFVMTNLPSSSIALHKNRDLQKGTADNYSVQHLNVVIKNAESSSFLKNFYEQCPVINFQCAKCIEKYNELAMFDTMDICGSTLTDRTLWEQERQFRVTGSRCYEIYTYSKNDWEKKCRTYFYPKQFSNVYTRHGIKYEPLARDVFQQNSGFSILQVGLLICRSQPWLAYSPDGILIKNGEPYGLLQIKCPYKAKQTSDLSNCCKYLIQTDGVYQLKRRHRYFGQVQLGMAILNLKICHFIIYFSSTNSYVEIKVPFDEEFSYEMLSNLKKKYCENMLHNICNNE